MLNSFSSSNEVDYCVSLLIKGKCSCQGSRPMSVGPVHNNKQLIVVTTILAPPPSKQQGKRTNHSFTHTQTRQFWEAVERRISAAAALPSNP